MSRTLAVMLIALALAATVAHAAPAKPCELMKMLMSSNHATQEKGIAGFVAMGDHGAVPLLCFISGKAPGAPHATDLGKRNAEEALVRIGGWAVPAILERLQTPDPEFRARLVRVLGRIQDIRRDGPLMALWQRETSDRVRTTLVPAMGNVKRASGLPLMQRRIPLAGSGERRPLLVQLARYGSVEDCKSLLTAAPAASRKALCAGATGDLRAADGSSATAAVNRIKAAQAAVR